MNNNFLTKSEFSKLVEKNVLAKKISYMESVLDICEIHNIDPEDVKKFISVTIQDKIKVEAMTLKLIPQGSTGILNFE